MNTVNETIKALIVDDEKGMCMGTQRILKAFSFKLEELDINVSFHADYVCSGQEFYNITDDKVFDLIIMDYKLPDANGLQLLEYFNTKNTDTGILMITAYATFETAVKATKLGAYDFIAKPYSPDELKYSVKNLVRSLLLSRNVRSYQEEKKRIRFEFVSVLSHELKSPLNALDGYLDMIARYHNKMNDEELELYLSRAKVRTHGMRKLVLDLLDLTRVESGSMNRELVEIDFKNLISESVESMKNEIAAKGITVDNNTEQTSCIIVADKTEIEMIVNNLVSNAVKYNNQNGKISIVVGIDKNNLILTVSDTGIGIAQEDQSKLFKDFSRIKNKKTENILGSGLGLSTIKKIVMLYEGEITVDSQVGTGSVFTVKLNNIVKEVPYGN